MLERVLKATPATISNTWYEDGAAVDPGVVTIDITRADGTPLVNDGATGTSGNTRTYDLTAASHTNQLDTLRIDWASPTKGTMTNYVEVVGGFLFSIADLDAKLQTSGDYTVAKKTAARTVAETAIEDACGVAFVPRYRRETISGTGLTRHLVSRGPVRSVRTVSVDGTALTASQLADVEIYAGRALYYAAGFTYGTANVVIGYEHGHDYAPPRVSQAAIILAKHYLVQGPIDERYTSVVTEDGTFTLSTPGIRGIRFGIPEVDAVVRQYGRSGVGVA